MFRNNLQNILEKRGISGLMVSRETGIAPADIYKLKKGTIKPYKSWKERLSQMLDMPISEIFPGEVGENGQGG